MWFFFIAAKLQLSDYQKKLELGIVELQFRISKNVFQSAKK